MKGGSKMKLRYKLGVGVSLTVLLLTLLSASCFAQMVSKPGEYSGYSTPVYNGYQRFSQYVTVQAGTPNESKLAVDFSLPLRSRSSGNTSSAALSGDQTAQCL
jgi:hypothetical protein